MRELWGRLGKVWVVAGNGLCSVLNDSSSTCGAFCAVYFNKKKVKKKKNIHHILEKRKHGTESYDSRNTCTKMLIVAALSRKVFICYHLHLLLNFSQYL